MSLYSDNKLDDIASNIKGMEYTLETINHHLNMIEINSARTANALEALARAFAPNNFKEVQLEEENWSS